MEGEFLKSEHSWGLTHFNFKVIISTNVYQTVLKFKTNSNALKIKILQKKQEFNRKITFLGHEEKYSSVGEV